MVSSAARYDRAMSALARLALVCAVVAACGEYAHTNPYDPATNVTIVIHGPDSAHSIFEEMSFTYDITPNWAGVVPLWRSDSGLVIGSRGPGLFAVNGPGTADVVLSVGTHTARHRVVVIQRPKRVYFTCFVGPCPTSVAVGRVVNLTVVQMDSLGTELVGGQPAAAIQYNVRPSGVLSIIAGTPSSVQVQGIGSGRAFVIATLGAWLDSVSVTVQ